MQGPGSGEREVEPVEFADRQSFLALEALQAEETREPAESRMQQFEEACLADCSQMAADMAAAPVALGQIPLLPVALGVEVGDRKEVSPAVVSPWVEDAARISSRDVSHQEFLI